MTVELSLRHEAEQHAICAVEADCYELHTLFNVLGLEKARHGSTSEGD
jgi:hypothetical protein